MEPDVLARGPDGAMELIQVSADPGAPGVLERELRALEEAGRSHPEGVRRLLTLTRDAIPERVPAGVEAGTAYEWILAGAALGSPTDS